MQGRPGSSWIQQSFKAWRVRGKQVKHRSLRRLELRYSAYLKQATPYVFSVGTLVDAVLSRWQFRGRILWHSIAFNPASTYSSTYVNLTAACPFG